MALVDDARDLLAAWRDGLVRDDDLVAWADDVLKELPSASVPEWLLDLAMYGPVKCTNRPSSDFIIVPASGFARALALRASVLDLGDSSQVEAFVEWAARACMGENLDEPAVKFGYHLDHFWVDCDRMDLAVELVRSQLPSLRNGLPQISDGVLRVISSSRESTH